MYHDSNQLGSTGRGFGGLGVGIQKFGGLRVMGFGTIRAVRVEGVWARVFRV